MKIERALLSVSDKTGIIEFAQGLQNQGIEMISTGGTAKLLKEAGIPVIDISDFTGFPEIMNGRVKTLNPKVHGGILARRDNPEHMKVAASHGISMIDLIVVNLYPFQKVTANPNVDLNEAIENIDIGGPAMIRAAAKNHDSVTVVTNPEDYQMILQQIQESGDVDSYARALLAIKVFRHTSQYDAAIDEYLSRKIYSEERQHFFCAQGKLLRYGENSHQQAIFYKDPSSKEESVANGEIVHGKEMSYNNFVDANAALEVVKDFPRVQPVVAIIKHINPCGLATGVEGADALLNAWEGDPISAFGGVVATNQKVDMKFAETLKGDKIKHISYKIENGKYIPQDSPSGKFIEILIAPDFDEDALGFLKKKSKAIRLIKTNPSTGKDIKTFRAITGGILIQGKDDRLWDDFNQVTKMKFKGDFEALCRFGWVACKHTKSNAIVLVRENINGHFQLVGMGSGQPNRIDAMRRLCIPKAIENLGREYDVKSIKEDRQIWIQNQIGKMVLVSDAFFPFDDTVREAAKCGISYIVQPGGSMRDQDSINACNELGIAMAFTGLRHFNH